jgi:hypothetical protein
MSYIKDTRKIGGCKEEFVIPSIRYNPYMPHSQNNPRELLIPWIIPQMRFVPQTFYPDI